MFSIVVTIKLNTNIFVQNFSQSFTKNKILYNHPKNKQKRQGKNSPKRPWEKLRTHASFWPSTDRGYKSYTKASFHLKGRQRCDGTQSIQGSFTAPPNPGPVKAQYMSYGPVFSLVSASRKLFFQNVIIAISLMYWDYARLKDMIPHLFFFSLSCLSYSSTRCSLDDSQTMKLLQLQCCCIKMGHNKYKDMKFIFNIIKPHCMYSIYTLPTKSLE